MMFATLTLAAVLSLASPDGRLAVTFNADADGIGWSLARDGKTLVERSPLGLAFAPGDRVRGGEGCERLAGLDVVSERRRRADSVWSTKLYRREEVRDRYNELSVDLAETEARAAKVAMGRSEATRVARRVTLVFRAYDEGVAFRYVIPEQEAFDGFEITDELTEWRFGGNPTVWATTYDGHENGNEEPFAHRRLSDLDGSRVIGLPLLMETSAGTVALCEAALSNWAGFYLRAVGSSLRTELTKLPATAASTEGSAVVAATPAKSPWRVVIVGDDELDLLRRNDILVNLNPAPDPSIDFSFVRPGATSWDWWAESNNSLSTERTLRQVDFAAEMGWPYHTIDGGWYGFARSPSHGPNVPLLPRKDFDLDRVVAHAKEKGVGIWVWIHWREIDDIGIEETFARLESWGVVGVKTDFINRQDQWAVNWYERVLRCAARHRICVNFHGAMRPTGTERTWPNNLTREGVLGNEMNIFHSPPSRLAVTPQHVLTLPFTRFLIGPGDFTPGGFGNVFARDFVHQTAKGHRHDDATDRCGHLAEQMGTRAFALAQCVAFDSYLTTLCDWPERYRGANGIEALRSLPTTWRSTTPVAGACGEFYEVVRQAHDGRWYFAALTVASRDVDLKLDFLGDGVWKASVFVDDPKKTPTDAKAVKIDSRRVAGGDVLSFSLCAEGGAVAVFEREGAVARDATVRDVEWSYPPRAWPRWEILRARAYTYSHGMYVGYPCVLADALQCATFRDGTGREFTLSASSCGGVPCVRGAGYEARDEFGAWTKCDVFAGTADAPPHLLGFDPVRIDPTVKEGLYVLPGETVAYVFCNATARPGLFVGESREEAMNEDRQWFEQDCAMIPTGRPGEWRSSAPLAFRFYRFREPVTATWVVRNELDETVRFPFRSDDARRQKIWQSAANTVRLCTRRFFVDAVKRDRMPWPGDDAINFLADTSTYRNAEAARFTIDALSCATFDGYHDYSPWWVILNGLYRRHYEDLGYIRTRWAVIRSRTDALAERLRPDGLRDFESGRPVFIDWGDRGRSPTTAYNILLFGAFQTAAALAEEIGETADAARYSEQARRMRTALMNVAYDADAGLFRPDINSADEPFYPHPNLLAVLFGLVDGEKARLIGDRLARGDVPEPGSTWMKGLEYIALMVTGHSDVVLRRIDDGWGEMVDRGFDVTFEHAWPDAKGAEAYQFYDRRFGLSLCHMTGASPAFLLPRIEARDFSNPFDLQGKDE